MEDDMAKIRNEIKQLIENGSDEERKEFIVKLNELIKNFYHF